MIVSAVLLLVLIVFNPIPELVYQGRTGASLETLKDSDDFVLENWIEWFLPLAVVCAPWGVSFFFSITSQRGRLGLDFFQLLGMPCAVVSQWFHSLGLPSSLRRFRGHLYKALAGSSRRQRAFLRRSLMRSGLYGTC